MKLYLIRHGQSEANVKEYFAGQTQVNLTTEGKQQAIALGKILNNLHFDKIYTSDLFRAIDTQKLSLPDCSAECTPLLREIDVGSLAGISLKDCLKKYGEELSRNRAQYNFRPYGGENNNDLHDRIRKFIDLIKDSKAENIAAFCHGGLISSFAEFVLGNSVDKYALTTSNCSISIFELTNDKWKINLYNYTGSLQ